MTRKKTKKRSSSKKEDSRMYAGLWLRLFAGIIDFIVLYSLGFILYTFMFKYFPVEYTSNVSLMVLIGVTIVWVYFAGMESSGFQGTLGKMFLNLSVTDMKKQRISFFDASKRFVVMIVSFLFLGFGLFMIGFTDKKQALHDMFFHTLVVKDKYIGTKVVMFRIGS